MNIAGDAANLMKIAIDGGAAVRLGKEPFQYPAFRLTTNLSPLPIVRTQLNRRSWHSSGSIAEKLEASMTFPRERFSAARVEQTWRGPRMGIRCYSL